MVAAVRTAEVLLVWRRLDGFLGPLLYRDATTRPDLDKLKDTHVLCAINQPFLEFFLVVSGPL